MKAQQLLEKVEADQYVAQCRRYEYIGHWFEESFLCRISPISPVRVRSGEALYGKRYVILEEEEYERLIGETERR